MWLRKGQPVQDREDGIGFIRHGSYQLTDKPVESFLNVHKQHCGADLGCLGTLQKCSHKKCRHLQGGLWRGAKLHCGSLSCQCIHKLLPEVTMIGLT
jgi:hypothetical protein